MKKKVNKIMTGTGPGLGGPCLPPFSPPPPPPMPPWICFGKGTKILMADGTEKNIEDIKVGDMVESYDEEKKELTTSKVSALTTEGKKTTDYYIINNKITVTKEHPFYINGEWVKAKDLKEGTNVLVSDGNGHLLTTNYIQSIKFVENDEIEVYNFEVEGTHNYFAEGVLVHNKWCFIAGTKVSMADGTEKNIEDVVIGDKVISWNEETGKLGEASVTKLFNPIHDDMIVLEWEHGTITNTFDHPYWSVTKNNWVSYKPDLTLTRYEFDSVQPLQVSTPNNPVGDIGFYYKDGKLVESKLLSIKEDTSKEVQTYIFELDKDNTFFANGMLVHNKGGGTPPSPPGPKGPMKRMGGYAGFRRGGQPRFHRGGRPHNHPHPRNQDYYWDDPGVMQQAPFPGTYPGPIPPWRPGDRRFQEGGHINDNQYNPNQSIFYDAGSNCLTPSKIDSQGWNKGAVDHCPNGCFIGKYGCECPGQGPGAGTTEINNEGATVEKDISESEMGTSWKYGGHSPFKGTFYGNYNFTPQSWIDEFEESGNSIPEGADAEKYICCFYCSDCDCCSE